MEDKLPSKETHVWTLSDFIERRKEWDQGDEARLAEYLQQLSNKITQGAKNTLNELENVVASIDDTAVKIANINNEFQLLADKQFIENKVQDEDETVQTKVEKPVLREINADTLVNNIKKALKNSFEAIDTHFEKITVVVSDSDDNDDELSHEETVLRPRIFYKKLNLPSLSGNTLSEIVVDNAMFSDSDSDVEQPTNTFKDQESLFSNDVPEEDNYSISESKNIYEPNPESIDTNNIVFEPEKPKPKNIPTYADYDEDDLFSPPPLINDDDDDNLENEYNIFGNGNNNMFGEKNLWDDIDDDDNDFSNEPPLPIYSDKPPLQELKSDTQVKVEVPNIQQTLNDELRKRFQKDSTSLSSDNLNVTSSKIKLPKGAVNILGGTDIKPYISNPALNIRPSTTSEINKKIAVTTQNDTIEDVKKDFNISNKVIDNSNPNSVNVGYKDLIKETKPIKKRSLFDQESDDDDLFTKTTVTVAPTLKPEMLESKASLTKDKISSRNIFSESDSDEEFMDSKLKTKELVFHSTIDNNSTTLLDSSSDDDLFSNKSINNIIPKQISSSPTHVEVVNKSNKTKHISKPSIEENKVKDALNKVIIDELKKHTVNLNVVDNKVIEKELLPNNNTSNSNIIESPNNDKIIQRNQKPSNSQQTKKLSNFFSSDEDDFDDETLLNVNKPNKNSIKKDQSISNASEFSQNTNREVHESKIKLFDSSSDDDLFITKPSDSLTSSTIKKQPSFNEIENIGISKEIDDCAILNKIPKIDKINQMENEIDKKNIKNCNLLSDDDEDENYLSFDKNISDIIASNNQNINEKISTISLSSEEFFSPQRDQNNQDMFQNTPDSLKESKNYDLFSQKEILMPKNEIMSNENTIQNNKNSIISSSEDETKLMFSSQIKNENSNIETKLISPTSNLSPENLLNNKNQVSLKEKDINTSNMITESISSENTKQGIENSKLSNSDGQQFSFNSSTQNVNTIQEIDVICPTSELSFKDSIDGPFFSSPNSKNETIKKLPGKLNKNAGAFINIASLLPNSKSPLKISDIPRSVSLDEKNDTLPTDGTKLFSAEKERARIQVKRRPQSRKARIAAARMSSIDIGSETNFEESSRLFVSTSDLVDYQSSPILNNDITVSDSSNEVKNKIQASINDKLLAANNNKTDVISDKLESKNELIKHLFDDDSDSSESIQQEFDKKDNDNKKIILGEKLLESNKSVQEQLPVIESVHKKLQQNEPVKEKQLETKPLKGKQPKIELINDEISEIDPIFETQVKAYSVKELEENKSKISNTSLPHKSNSLFDDDDDDDDLFSRKSGKTNKLSSNLFDSDDEFEFNKKFTKKNSDKTKSIFGDDSDDDLFNTPNKPSGSNLTSQKPINKLNQQQNRSSSDGYVKLAAESVAVNPLESKK